jgi:hypothetical protein
VLIAAYGGADDESSSQMEEKYGKVLIRNLIENSSSGLVD